MQTTTLGVRLLRSKRLQIGVVRRTSSSPLRGHQRNEASNCERSAHGKWSSTAISLDGALWPDYTQKRQHEFGAAPDDLPSISHRCHRSWRPSQILIKGSKELLEIAVWASEQGQSSYSQVIVMWHSKGDLNYPGLLPNDFTTASAARSPDSQAPPTVPHRVSCAASPANQMRSFTDSISTLRDG
jgi:hypothetical protein